MVIARCGWIGVVMRTEEIYLGAAILDHEVLALAPVESFDFGDLECRKLHMGMLELMSHGRVPDLVALSGYVSGSWLAGLVDGMPTRQMGLSAAKRIREDSVKRRLVKFLEEAAVEAREDSGKALERVQANLITLQGAPESVRSFHEVASQWRSDLSAGRNTLRVETGDLVLDNNLIFDAGGLHIIAGRPGMGKQVPVDTKVLTRKGWIRIGSLSIGDKIYTKSGRETTVTGIFPQGKKQAYQIMFRDKTTVECGIEHLWSVAPSSGSGRKKFRVKTLGEIIKAGISKPFGGRKKARWRVPLCDPIRFPERKLPISPYVLGVLIGDGSTCGRMIQFSNPDMDSDIRERVDNLLPEDVDIGENRSGICPYFYFRGPGAKRMRMILRAIKLDVKSGHKFIPDDYKLGSIEQRTDLLRGLMDTDGSSMGNRVNFFTTSKRLASDVAELVRSLGGLSVIRKYDRTGDGKTTEYVVNVKVSFCPFYTQRKARKWKPQYPSRYIWGIKKSREVDQVCISVDAKDGLYLMDNHTVTHNTSLALWIAERITQRHEGVLFFSLEMTGEQLVTKLLSQWMGVGGWALTREYEKHSEQIFKTIFFRKELPLMISDANQSVERLSLVAQFMCRYRGVKLVIVDYLQLLRSANRFTSREQEVGYISGSLKALAKSLGVPVIALAQLNRMSETRDGKRPMLSDLRESGSVEADADSVSLIFRPEYYARMTDKEVPQDQIGLVELNIAKQRRIGPRKVIGKWIAETNQYTWGKSTL